MTLFFGWARRAPLLQPKAAAHGTGTGIATKIKRGPGLRPFIGATIDQDQDRNQSSALELTSPGL